MNTKAFRERWPSIAQIPCVGDMLAAMDAVEANRQEALTELADCERRLREATQDAVANGQEVKRLERESFERITALRLALRQVHDLADATEPCSVQAGQIAARALEVDGSVEYRRDAEEPPYHHCEQCGASPAHLFDHTPLEEHGTWERLCNNCIDKTLEQWQSSQQAVDRARAALAPDAGSHVTPEPV